MIDLTVSGMTGLEARCGLGLGMPSKEEIGFQLTLTDGGNIEIYLYTIQGLVSNDKIIHKVHHQRLG